MDWEGFVLKISLVIAAFEEGPDLEATVALAVASQPEPHEIIVVDDQSTQPVEPRLAAFPSVKVYRTPERLGAGPAKSYGGNKAEGDLIVLMDSHLRFSQDWLRFVSDAFSRYPDAIMCPVSTGFEQDFTFAGAGARFNRREKAGMGLSWLGVREKELIDLVPAVLGGCYFIPRKIWKSLGGLNPNLRGWGFEEPDLSLRAWASGFECRCINGLRVAHNYNRTPLTTSPRLDQWQPAYNALVVALTVFDDATFNQRILPYARFTCGSHFDDAIHHIQLNRQDIEDFRDEWQTRKVFQDFEIEGLTGFQIPTMSSVHAAKDEDIKIQSDHAKAKADRIEFLGEHDRRIHERIERNCGCGDDVDVSNLPEV